MWKIIPNTNDLYQCNKEGEIMRVNQVVSFGSQCRKVGGKRLSQKTKANGYKEVQLYLETNKGTSKYVHRLIVETFLGSIPKGFNVNHKDGNKTNNKLNNLEIVSFSDNTRHAIRNGLMKPRGVKGSEHPRSKVNEQGAQDIRSRYRLGVSVSDLAKEYPHISKSTVSKIAYGYTWKHI